MSQLAQKRRPAPEDLFDPHEQSSPYDEKECLAYLCNLIDRDPEAGRQILANLTADMWTIDCGGDVFTAIKAAYADAAPSIGRVGNLLRSRCDHLGYDSTEPMHLLVDLLSQKEPLRGLQDVAAEAARNVRELFVRRTSILATGNALSKLHDRRLKPADLRDVAAHVLSAAELLEGPKAGRSGYQKLTLVDAIDKWAKQERSPVVPTGLGWFDRPTDGGLPIGGITMFVALPNVGKTAIALQLALSAMVHDPDLATVWALGDMTDEQMGERTACLASSILDNLDAVTMTDSRKRTPAARAANVALAKAVGERFHIVGVPLTVEAIEKRVVETSARLVVVDYLQKIRTPNAADRVQDLEQIITQIRDMAITRECAVVCISSIARGATANAQIGALAKGATEIDYACDLVYLGESDEQAGTVTWHCKKGRNVEKRDLALEFDGHTQTYAPQGFPEFAEFTAR